MHDDILCYLDPGSASIFLQILVAGFLGSLLALRTSWSRITGLFRNLLVSGKGEEGKDE